jgi:hypothetical protein
VEELSARYGVAHPRLVDARAQLREAQAALALAAQVAKAELESMLTLVQRHTKGPRMGKSIEAGVTQRIDRIAQM